jgi:hypothetical protein
MLVLGALPNMDRKRFDLQIESNSSMMHQVSFDIRRTEAVFLAHTLPMNLLEHLSQFHALDSSGAKESSRHLLMFSDSTNIFGFHSRLHLMAMHTD